MYYDDYDDCEGYDTLPDLSSCSNCGADIRDVHGVPAPYGVTVDGVTWRVCRECQKEIERIQRSI